MTFDVSLPYGPGSKLRSGEASSHWYQALFETGLLGVAVVRLDAAFVRANETFCAMVGYRGEKLSGLTLMQVVDQNDWATVQQAFTVISRVGGRKTLYIRWCSKDGQSFYASSELIAIRGQIGQPALFLLLMKDEREQQAREQDLMEMYRNEQLRMADDLHDDLGSCYAAIAMLAWGAADGLKHGQPVKAAILDKIVRLANDAIERVRVIIRGISPEQLSLQGLDVALQKLVAALNSHAGVAIMLDCDALPALDAEAALHLYRIAQEALSNVIKHAKAKHVLIRLNYTGNSLTLSVQDDGIGFAETNGRGAGVGIMHRRARLIGAELSIGHAPVGGTLIVCRLPVQEAGPRGGKV